MSITTVNIKHEVLDILGDLAAEDKRSKTQELEFLVEQEKKRRLEHK